MAINGIIDEKSRKFLKGRSKNQRIAGGEGGIGATAGDLSGTGANTSQAPSKAVTQSSPVQPTNQPQTVEPTPKLNSSFQQRSGTLGGTATTSGTPFELTAKTGNQVQTRIGNVTGTVSQNVADKLGRGGGSFNVLPASAIQASNRLDLARNAVSQLRAKGASPAAQLQAFQEISRYNESPQQVFERKAVEAAKQGISGNAQRFGNLALSYQEAQANADKVRLGAEQAQASDQLKQFNKDRAFQLDLNKYDANQRKFFSDTFSRVNAMKKEGTPSKDIANQAFQTYRNAGRPIDKSVLYTIFDDLGNAAAEGQGIDAQADIIQKLPDISPDVKDYFIKSLNY